MSGTQKRSSQTSRSVNRLRNERKKRNNSIILFSFISLFIGHYILNYVAVLKEPPLGATFNIILGCVIIAVALLVIAYTVKKQYFPKRRRRTQHIFLDEEYLKKNGKQSETKSETEKS